MDKTLKLAAASLLGLGISLAAVQAQSPSLSVTPANPTMLVGQTQQFTANGQSIPATIDGGGNHACMLMSDRSVQCFGQNNWGQIGDGHFFTNATTPVPVSGLTNAVDVGAGMEHSCALIADGTMQCWGTSYVGQTGDGTFGGWSDVPKPVLNLSGAIAGIVGGFHTCAILSDRSMRCWGRNEDGQLGNGDAPTDRSVPQTVIGLDGPVSAATAGGYHTCAIMPDATVRCWGRNTRGQLGDGTDRFFSSTPVPVSGLTNVAAVSGGGYHTCALLRDGTVQCWGENDHGQLGNTLPYSNRPVEVAGIGNAVAISTGFLHSCAVLSDGATRCWGHNISGQLGNGSVTNSSTPVQVGGLSGPIQIAAGGAFEGGHSCALLPDRSVRCWGWNAYGQLGNGTTTDSLTPVAVSGVGGLTWTSSDATVATIDAAGRAAGIRRGTTTITATDGLGGTASTTLTVRSLEALSVAVVGSGSGTVSSSPAGIACGADCSESYLDGTAVTLTAAPAAGSILTGWTGCDSTAGMSCTVAMTAARSVTATFARTYPLTVTKSGVGGGTITSNPDGINCGGTCTAPFIADSNVTLTAAPNLGSVLLSWSGCDTSTGTSCTVQISAAKTVTATFVGVPITP
jgi:alpha-tubulin suppressor-like RCC1 family protein